MSKVKVVGEMPIELAYKGQTAMVTVLQRDCPSLLTVTGLNISALIGK